MQIDIGIRQLQMTRSLNRYAHCRIRFAPTRFEEHIQRISMWLSQADGPQGGRDKHCRLPRLLAENASVIIEDVRERLYVAINRAIERAGQFAVHKLDRQQSRLQRSCTVMFESPVSA